MAKGQRGGELKLEEERFYYACYCRSGGRSLCIAVSLLHLSLAQRSAVSHDQELLTPRSLQQKFVILLAHFTQERESQWAIFSRSDWHRSTAVRGTDRGGRMVISLHS
ncbi:hypothetical protein Q8A73_003022 [Channa argus]|nr:hypothetical protein Q8A73_003022 [Channa argus]